MTTDPDMAEQDGDDEDDGDDARLAVPADVGKTVTIDGEQLSLPSTMAKAVREVMRIMEVHPAIVKKATTVVKENKPGSVHNLSLLSKTHPMVKMCKTLLWSKLTETAIAVCECATVDQDIAMLIVTVTDVIW